MVYDIPSTKHQNNITFCRPKCSFLKHVNRLQRKLKEYKFSEEICLCRQRPTKLCSILRFLIKNGKKSNRLKILNTIFFEDIYKNTKFSNNKQVLQASKVGHMQLRFPKSKYKAL